MMLEASYGEKVNHLIVEGGWIFNVFQVLRCYMNYISELSYVEAAVIPCFQYLVNTTSETKFSMPKTNFQYDESGNTFYYFLLTFLGIILFPSTYYFWPQEEKVDPEKKKKYTAHAKETIYWEACLEKGKIQYVRKSKEQAGAELGQAQPTLCQAESELIFFVLKILNHIPYIFCWLNLLILDQIS